MYKVLIVDDEPIIREGLKCFIDWESKGFSIVGEAENGKKAEMFFDHNPVDVIITDIRMPEMDGFELMDRIHGKGFYPPFIILSGYNEFEYAREAMKREAVYYLLKPFQEEELISTIETLRKKLESSITEIIMESCKPGTNVRRIIWDILEYMEEHIGDGKILQHLCGKFSFSENYLSQMMKDELGDGFIQILTRMRIEKAKRLLKNDLSMKTYEIADLVGYDDPQYFSRLFHKKTGMTPTQYRESFDRADMES